MSDRQAFRQFDRIAFQWRGLVERRRNYFSELHASGRWKRFYTEEEFAIRLREAMSTAETWAKLAPSAAELLAGIALDARAGAEAQDPAHGISQPRAVRRAG